MRLPQLFAPIVMIVIGIGVAAAAFTNPELGKALSLGLGGFLVGFGTMLALLRMGRGGRNA